MSGHSKWSKIHRQKGVADNKRGALFTKLGKTITVAAKMGGADVDANFKLRLAIDQAKASSMPKENIDRAIKRGSGEMAGGIIEELTYEGFGPEGVAFIIEALTDNRNRTAAAIKHTLSKYGGSLGGPGSVAWMFEQKGVIRSGNISEELELELIDAGASDVVSEDDETIVYTAPNDLQKVKVWLEQKKIVVTGAAVEQVAKEIKPVAANGADQVIKVFNELDDNEDVNNFFTNADL